MNMCGGGGGWFGRPGLLSEQGGTSEQGAPGGLLSEQGGTRPARWGRGQRYFLDFFVQRSLISFVLENIIV